MLPIRISHLAHLQRLDLPSELLLVNSTLFVSSCSSKKYSQITSCRDSMCDPHSLGVQVVLTGEPALVASVCSLLQKALQRNAEALPSLYQTGLYFFALAYCGSNLLEIARLFQVYMSLVPASLRERLSALGSSYRQIPRKPDMCLLHHASHNCSVSSHVMC